ncbi:hypothetical protein FZC33_08215 [Labrys sp. KNU-23]|uniref:hypothetical protein n=1 Tax=Labrys sp. KNU-23 TaxID=2789216 RepID=UPI0011EE8DB6|nr:hypothetical protein [Labrys sp. KNU-23]QEN86159.1 hypothetical protein FZC33_08215 [Labrys sp. KNU-23]
MIADLDIGCWQPSQSLQVPALSRCHVSARHQATSRIEILRKDDVILVQYSVGRGNNNGNGNTGNFNGNFNQGNNNGNFNSGNGNGNCFTDDNNGNHDAAAYSWDYKRLMKELQRCGITPRQVP